MRAEILRKTPAGETQIQRFSPLRRAEHVLVTVTFVVLVVTGFPQKLYGDGSVWLLAAMGGLDHVRLIHRIAGVVFSLHAAVHLLAILVGLVTRRMRPSLLPVPQDLRDAWRNLLYYLGARRRPPALPKFDYRQKFEYMGLLLGGLVMIFSGLALMYPTLVASWLPGQLIPAARVAHSNEALLALLVLVVWHVYGAHLSPDVFPLDRSIFTGYVSKEHLRKHHGREYERIFGEPAEPAAMPATTEPAATPATPEPAAMPATTEPAEPAATPATESSPARR
ncbi:MAG: cytochrome b/b6 domain-containing protein [Deltaproteobacteria bacterium]|nr:cytochrome b/b6 domain-containing protein [Deltaproteobacteria bacterium]